MNKPKLVLERNSIFDSYSVNIFERIEGTNKISIVKDIVFEEVEVGTYPNSSLMISTENAQYILDQLWNNGLRPSYGHDDKGVVSAKSEHITDLRGYVDRLLKLVEK